jgi:putative transposase
MGVATAAAIATYNAEHDTTIDVRRVHRLNNIVEQDHRAVERVVRPMLGFMSREAAQRTLAGIEVMHMIKKEQMVMEEGTQGQPPAQQLYPLAA